MKSIGKHYFEVPAARGSDIVRISILGKGRNQRIVISGNGRLISTPMVRAKRGPLKGPPILNEGPSFNATSPKGFTAW